ncbi:hypothetical protein [Mixta calida]|uniref:hypothetical protein n=1 Tax=Mixta calida TaxID=665913 RepID=UPI002898819F|nr:hypothetical protein [Mixta calida]
MEDCIFFEVDKDPYVDQVNPEKHTVSFGTDEEGNGIWRRIGVFSITSPGIEEKYLYVSEHAEPPSKESIKAAINALKPKPYTK